MPVSRSPAWLDQQYNARAGIPDAPAILQGWAERSARARAAIDGERDVSYVMGRDDPATQLDLFLPDPGARPAGGAPVLVHIHGGYWRALDKRDQSFVAEPFVRRGALVVVPNYALCPQVTVREIVLQMVQALAWTWRHAARFGGDRSRIVVTGHSAGGHLAAMMLACDWRHWSADLPADLVRTALPISGLFDLQPLRRAPFLAPDLRLSVAEARALSPVAVRAPAHGQLLPFVGALESAEFHRQNTAIRRAWGAARVAPAVDLAGCHHLGVLDALVDERSPLHAATLRSLGLDAPS